MFYVRDYGSCREETEVLFSVGDRRVERTITRGGDGTPVRCENWAFVCGIRTAFVVGFSMERRVQGMSCDDWRVGTPTIHAAFPLTEGQIRERPVDDAFVAGGRGWRLQLRDTLSLPIPACTDNPDIPEILVGLSGVRKTLMQQYDPMAKSHGLCPVCRGDGLVVPGGAE